MNDLQRITQEQAHEILTDLFGKLVHRELFYYSWPQIFSNTAGPFYQSGMFTGQAFTQFQMECWTDGAYALIFSKGREVKSIKCSEPFTVEWYLGQRGNW